MGSRKIVTVHSYRGGTGKSNLTANLAVCAVEQGKRVAVLDTDLQSPGVHVLFGYREGEIRLTLLDFLWGRSELRETAYDATPRVCPTASGRCYLVPASLTAEAITRVIEDGYDIRRLNAHIDQLLTTLDLDYLLIDTHPGLNKETLLATAISDVLLIVLRPDEQDYQGTAILKEVAGQLDIPHTFLIVNKILSRADRDRLRERIEGAFGHEVIGMLPLSEEFAAIESRDVFVRRHPDHEISHTLRGIVARWPQ
ncbi:MAG: MinD/ParA family ATP-binding protein [Planctomycetota bacterium]